jgi:hypothetical protein
MNIGKTIRSLFRPDPPRQEVAGWTFTIQAHLDLKRHIVLVHIADEAQAEAKALTAVAGIVVAKTQAPPTVMANVGLERGQHKVQATNGWSFSVESPTGEAKPLVFVYLSDEQEAEAVALKVVNGTIVSRSEVPPSVLADLGMQPGSTRAI